MKPVLFLLSFLVSNAASPQGVSTPEKGSEERQAILDAARMKVATDLSYRGAIRFRVDHLTVYQGWALLHGQPVTPAGVPIRKKCLEADDITAVLLHQRDGVWRVERGGTTCATDVFWLGWQEELDAPRQLFQISD